jgi:capsular polysaccharide biosynthesis protein
MAEPTAAHARDLGDYVSLVRRRWTWIAGSVLVGLALATAYLSLAQQTYMSTAKVLVKSTGGETTSTAVGARTSGEINLDTEAQLVKSEPVSTRAGELLGSDQSPVSLANKVTVTVPPNTTVLSISFAAPSAEEAQDGASAFAQAYLENRQDDAQEQLSANIDRLEDQRDQTSKDIQDTSVAIAKLSGPGESSDRSFMIARRSTLGAELASINAELAPLVAANVNPGEVILEAQLPGGPVDPNPLVVIPAGLMAGLVIGLGIAAMRERFDKRIHTNAEVERLFGIVPLSTLVARGRGRFTRIDHDVRAFYHSLRANGPDRGEVVLLVGPDAGDTAEHLSYSVAVLASRSGSETAFVTRPASPVLAERRRSHAEKNDALDLPDYEKLGVMVDGEFRSAVLREELDEISSSHEFVILGLPNDDPTVDLPILGRHVDVAVVVIRLGITGRDAVAAVLSDLTKSGVDRVFAVTVDLGRKRGSRDRVVAGDVFGGPAGPRPVTVESTVVESSNVQSSRRPRGEAGRNGNGPSRAPRRDGGSSAVSAGRQR